MSRRNAEDDDVAHVLDDDDDVVVSDDDEVNLATNMGLRISQIHGGDAGGSPPGTVPNRPVPEQCVPKPGISPGKTVKYLPLLASGRKFQRPYEAPYFPTLEY
ncbi:hypothetical protein Tco_1517172 [Tanacetum coccineum]